MTIAPHKAVMRSFHKPCRRRRRNSTGFTLMELMTVVVVIGIFATIATPSVVNLLRENRSKGLAAEIAGIYRSSKLRAMGQGAAILVRYQAGTQGELYVYEAVRRTASAAQDSGSAPLPRNSCLRPDWNGTLDDDYREISRLVVANTGITSAKLTMEDAAGNAITTLDVCFTPMGRTFTRTNTAGLLAPMTSATLARIARYSGASVIGRVHNVVVLPTGMARLTFSS